AAERITAARLREDLYFISSDEMAGRDTPSPGLDETARFIAARLAKLKLKPAGDDKTYFQRIALRSFKVDPEGTKAQVAGRAYKFGQDFLAGTANGQAAGPLVYVGHGYRIDSKNINAYRGVDVRDKIVVTAAGVLPPGVARGELKGEAGGEWDNAASYARRNGARGLIQIPKNFERYWRFGRFRANRDSFQVERFQDQEADSLPTITPSAEMINALFANEKWGGEEILKSIVAGGPGEAFDLAADKAVSFQVSAVSKTATTQNVVAVLEGRDSQLKKEYVAVGAHYDHVGTGAPDKNGDRIYNGADDDGSGTVAVLAMAEAFARGPRPKRSILFVWHAAEEKG
ncbi:MAG: M28 family peptidase, partial [Pyrinomonadaceae bacterium]